jgi:hypothetical protein
MTNDEFSKLKAGDVIRGKATGDEYEVTRVPHCLLIGIRSRGRTPAGEATASIPDHWEFVSPPTPEPPPDPPSDWALETLRRSEVMSRAASGEKVECSSSTCIPTWRSIEAPSWDWLHHDYRIAEPPPKLVERWAVYFGTQCGVSYNTEEEAQETVKYYSGTEPARIVHLREVEGEV